jgi:hypothetical protein
MFRSTVGLIGVAALVGVLGAAGFQSKQIHQVRWLAGCWQLDDSQREVRVVEQWTDNRGGLMLGTSRTFKGQTVTEYEFSAIGADSTGRLSYEARPARQAPATFALASITETSVTFTNPAHDFPTSISYARRGGDSAVATIEGPGGKQILFAYRRITCANSDDR